MWTVVGLGNPGPTYADTRHNVGFVVTDVLAARWEIRFDMRPDVRLGAGSVAGRAVRIVQPQTYMNRSGEVVAQLVSSDASEVIAVYDDLDLPTGALRIRPRGGSAGHRGVASLVRHLGEAFVRVRIGIGRPPAGMPVADYVLDAATGREAATLRAASARAADAVECIVANGTGAAMNRFNHSPAEELIAKEL